MVDRIMPPSKDVHVLILRLWICYFTWSKYFPGVIKLSLLTREDYPGLSRWTQYNNHKSPYKRDPKASKSEGDVMTKVEGGIFKIKSPWAKECRNWRRPGQILSPSLQKELKVKMT